MYPQVKLAAEKIGFRGDYNRSYLFRNARVPVSPSKDDSEEDETIDIENQIDDDWMIEIKFLIWLLLHFYYCQNLYKSTRLFFKLLDTGFSILLI